MIMSLKMGIFYQYMIQINFQQCKIFQTDLIKQIVLNLENVQMNYIINVKIMLKNKLHKECKTKHTKNIFNK